MSVNTANTPDGMGILLYNGEVILVYATNVTLQVNANMHEHFRGKYRGAVYLTSHRIIFKNDRTDEFMHTFDMPFGCLQDVTLEQPIFWANYMKGIANAMAGSPIAGQISWSLTFSSGGCIDFGQALLSAVEMAGRMRPSNAPPAYAPPVGSFYAAPPAYYQPTNAGSFQAPTQVFPDRPDPNSVFVNEAPPPYTGIGSEREPQATEELVRAGETVAPPSYEATEGVRRRR